MKIKYYLDKDIVVIPTIDVIPQIEQVIVYNNIIYTVAKTLWNRGYIEMEVNNLVGVR
jgi:hypothetical protein